MIVLQLGTRLRKCSFFYFFFVLAHVFIKQGTDCAKPRLQNSLALSSSLPSTAPKVLELQLPPHPSRNPSIPCCLYVPYYFGFQVPNFIPLHPLMLLLFDFTRYPQFPHRVQLLRQPSLSKTFRLTAASTKIRPLATFLPHFFLRTQKKHFVTPN